MTLFLTIVAWTLTTLAAAVLTINYGCVIKSRQNKRLGIDKHVSTVPLLVPVLCTLASNAATHADSSFAPGRFLLLLVLLDPSLWGLVALPFFLLRRGR